MKKFAKTKNYIYDMDWRKQSKKGYADIPMGEKVEIVDEGINNTYGYDLVMVLWNNNKYLTKMDFLERI